MNDRQQKVLDFLDTSGVRLHVLLTRLTQSEETAAELLQELFLRLMTARGFEKAENPYSYACRAAMNLAFEYRRKLKVKNLSLNDKNVLENGILSPVEKMIRVEEVRRLLDVLSRMKSLERDVIVLRFLEQESYERIAEQVGKNPSHIRSCECLV